jgi:serine/threonine protein kinase
MDCFGASLSRVRKGHKGGLSGKIVLNLALEMVKVIERLHDFGFVHGDIKPGNFLLNKNQAYPLVLIDFGLAHQYRQANSGEHRSQENGEFRGTKRYCSINALKKKGLGRRDDMMSWFYAVVEFYQGKLPWNYISDRKALISARKGLDLSLYPPEFEKLYKDLWDMGYDECPDYAKIQGALKDVLRWDYGMGPKNFSWSWFYGNEMEALSDQKADSGDVVQLYPDGQAMCGCQCRLV